MPSDIVLGGRMANDRALSGSASSDRAYRGFDRQPPELGPAGREMSIPREAVQLLLHHKLLFVLVVALVATCGGLVAWTLPAKYTASSTVLIETSHTEAVTLNELLSDTPGDAEALATELELLNSRELLERACTELGLLNNPEFNPALHRSTSSALLASLTGGRFGAAPDRPAASARPMNDVLDAFRRHLLIAPVGRARAIRITFVSQNPQTAAAAVNMIASLYTEEHANLREQATRDANSWIGDRLALLRQRADASAAAVEQYKSQHGLIRSHDSLLVEQQVTEVSTQLTSAQAHHAETRATLADAERALASGRPENVSTVLNSPLIQQLREQEALLAAQRADIVFRLGDAHPAKVAVDAQLADMRAQINTEAMRIVQSLRNADAIAAANEAAMAARLAGSRGQVDQANTFDVGLRERQREADTDDAFYRTFLTRSKETDPQFNFPRVNVRVLSWAVPPEHASSPNRGLIGIGGLALGLVLAFGAIVLQELLAKGIRRRSDFESLIGAAPLGIIPFLRRPGRPIGQAKLQDAVTLLWARLMTSPSGSHPKSIVVTSAVPREGKTTFVRLFGIVAAERGQRVLIVDADLRCSALTAQMVGTAPARGLAEIIRGEATMADVAVSHLPNLDIIPAGRSDRNPVRMLTLPAFTAFVRQAEREYDLVILDSPPVLIDADAELLAGVAQETLLMARWGHTSPAAVTAALRQLAEVRVQCAGVVLSLVNIARHAQYDEASSLSRSRRARRYYMAFEAPR